MNPSSTPEPSNNSRRSMMIGGRLLRSQVAMLRGLQARLHHLNQSRLNDQSILHADKERQRQAFAEATEQLHRRQASAWRELVTEWDSSLDQKMANAERETFLSVNQQRLQTEHLKSELKTKQSNLKKEVAQKTADLKKRCENACTSAAALRENTKAKLDKDRQAIEQQVSQCREWIGLKTGNLILQSLKAQNVAENAKEAQEINELSQVRQRIDELKKSIEIDIKKLHSHPVNRLLGSAQLLFFGPLAGSIGAAIAWSLQAIPLMIGVVGVVTGIIVAAAMHLLAVPLVARSMRRLFPPVVEHENLAYQVLQQGRKLAETNCQREIARLEQQLSVDLQQLADDHQQRREALLREHDTTRDQIVAASREKRSEIAKTRADVFMATDMQWKPSLESLEKNHTTEWAAAKQEHMHVLSGLEEKFRSSQQRAIQRWVDGCEQSSNRMHQLELHSRYLLPDWSDPCYVQGTWPRLSDTLAWRIGQMEPNEDFRQRTLSSRLSKEIPTQPWSVFFDLISQGSMVLYGDAESRDVSDKIVRNLLLRAITSIPAGSLNVTIIDPEGLGKKFSWLMALADIDPALVNQRVWTQPLQIAEQLAYAARHVEDVIQQSLRNEYPSILEYNRQAGPMAIPYRLIVWPNFPAGLDDSAWRSLCSIASSGGRCGVGIILQVNDSGQWPSFASRAKLEEFGVQLQLKKVVQNNDGSDAKPRTQITLNHPELSSYPVQPELPPDEPLLRTIMEHHLEDVTQMGKIVVPFEAIAISGQGQQLATSAQGLTIPLGISDAGRVQALRLGAGTAQHVLIAGKTGSGKSSLLHTMITSAATQYSPNELRLVLLDFKKGVEFQVYAEAGLSHADVIGIESKREFGVSALEYLDRILHVRGEVFRQFGVQDLPSLIKRHPGHAMPRILVVIDEFQELFVEEDKLSQQASLLMDRIVRQGRSFGIHLVLASQTLGGAYSLPRTTLSQMAVRIALQCDSSDAMLILDEDNNAAERLRHSGQAIYNDAGGRREANQPFQVAYLEKEDQLRRLAELPQVPVPHSPTTNVLGRQIVFEGHKPAAWDERSVLLALSANRLEAGAVPMILGDSVSIDPPVTKSLTRNAGRNVMVVGQDESCAASLLAGTLTGFLQLPQEGQAADNSKPSIIVLDGTRAEDEHMRRLVGGMRDLPFAVQTFDVRGIEQAMASLHEELERRNQDRDALHPPMLVVVANLSRFRELRRSDEFSFGDDGSGASKPDAVLAAMLRDGPSVGMHVWIWADSAGTLSRWLVRQSLRDIELRILMQMSVSDSNQLIDSNAANRLDKFVALIHDDIEGKAIKFRPFELESVMQRLKVRSV